MAAWCCNDDRDGAGLHVSFLSNAGGGTGGLSREKCACGLRKKLKPDEWPTREGDSTTTTERVGDLTLHALQHITTQRAWAHHPRPHARGVVTGPHHLRFGE